MKNDLIFNGFSSYFRRLCYVSVNTFNVFEVCLYCAQLFEMRITKSRDV